MNYWEEHEGIKSGLTPGLAEMAVGIGSELVNTKMAEQGDFQGTTHYARQFIEEAAGII